MCMTSAPFCMHKRQSRCVSVCFQMRACEAVVQARAIAERRSRPRFLPLSPSLALALSMFSLLIPFALAFCRPGTRSRPDTLGMYRWSIPGTLGFCFSALLSLPPSCRGTCRNIVLQVICRNIVLQVTLQHVLPVILVLQHVTL